MLDGAPEGRGDDAGILHYTLHLADFAGYFVATQAYWTESVPRSSTSGAAFLGWSARRCPLSLPDFAQEGRLGGAWSCWRDVI